MNPVHRSGIFLLAVFTGIVAITALTSKVEKRFRNEGFQYLGALTTEKEGRAKVLGGSGISAQAMMLYMHPTMRLNQSDAVRACASMEGKLVSILNPFQDGDIRMALAVVGATDPIWTSGIWDNVQQGWYWTTAERLAWIYQNFNSVCRTLGNGYGIVYQPAESGHWCSNRIETLNRFICSF